MPKFGSLGKFFGRTVSEGAAFAAGVATAPTLSPAVEEVRQTAWAHVVDHSGISRIPDVGTLAEGVSQGQVNASDAAAWAKRNGYGDDAWKALVAIANVGPGMAQAFNLWRRQQIDKPGFYRALKRLGLEAEWIDDLWAVRMDVLSPGELAAAIHRGLVPDPGLLKGEQPGPDRTVEAYPVYGIDAVDEAQASGYDRARLGVLVGLQGLPMGPVQAANAFYKGIITHDDYIAAFNESNQRNEWAQAYLDDARQIPTARDYIENALRGYIEWPEAAAGAARHGMSEADARLIFQNSGRAMNLHQITQALAYGAKYNPTPDDDPDPYHQSTLVGPLRPEYYELNEALKYTLPSALYFRTLQSAGVLTVEQAETWYLRLGWPPDLAKQVAVAFGKQRASAEKEASASDLLALYDGGRLTEAQTLAALGELGYPADEAQRKLDTLAARRVASAKATAISDLHGGYKKGELSGDAVLTALAALGLPQWAIDEIAHAWVQWFNADAQTHADDTTTP